MIFRIGTKRKIGLFLIMFILFTTLGYAAPFFTQQFKALKTITFDSYTITTITKQQQSPINPFNEALDFNLFVEESVSSANGNMEGAAAFGGDLNLIGTLMAAGINAGTFRVNGDAANTSLLIGGKINYISGGGINVNQNSFVKLGDATGSNIHDMQGAAVVNTHIAPGDYNSSPKVALQIHQPTSSVAQSNLIDFGSSFAIFREYTTAISEYTATTSMAQEADRGIIDLTPNQVNVINITSTELAEYTSIIFNQQPSASQPLIINIDAPGTFNWTVPSSSGVNDPQGPYILYNFYNTEVLILNGGSTINGNILAPNADLTKNNSGNISGQVVSKAYTHVAGELHYFPFEVELDITLGNVEVCGNNQDDDHDGLIDNYDDDCCPNLSIIPQANYTLHYADSEQPNYGEATNAFDGDTETIWHTSFDQTTYPLPHEIQIDLGQIYKLGGLRYLPNRTFADGRMGDYEVYVSTNGNAWGTPVATGTLTYSDLGDKEISFPLTKGRYIKLVALSDTNGTNWTTALELNILECKGQEICDDNIDNDGDGLIDCEDPDCSATVSLSATMATNCGEDINISVNQCITYATIIADTKGNVTDASLTIDAPDGAAAFLNRLSDGTYTRMVWDFGEVIPDGEEVCFRVRSNSTTSPSEATAWLLNSGIPVTASYSVVTTQTFVGTEWQNFCFTMPRASRYIKITDDGGAPFYMDAVGRKCRATDDLSYLWNTGETTSTIAVNGARSTTYSVAVTSPGGCTNTSTIAVTGLSGCPEICNNGRDDDGDGFIDGGDPDCGTDCNESLLFVARDNAQLSQVNLNTGAVSIAGQSPFTNGNLNATAANPDAGLIYYGREKTVYYWNPITDVHGTLIDLNGQVGIDESLTSGGGGYFNNYLYLGFEDNFSAGDPTIYQLPLTADGLSTTGAATNLNVPIPSNTSWGDMVITTENSETTIYAGLGYNGDSNTSLYFKYQIESGTYTTIRTDMPSALQLGIDVNGNLWGGGLETGTIQQIDRTTGNFIGNSLFIGGGDMWDLTGPINCPQKVEICNNGKDDDGDGRIDSDDDDCNCPMVATTDNKVTNICQGETVSFTVMTDASTIPFHEVEFYRFATIQANPYTSTAAKTLIGAFNNDTGMGSISSDDFPVNNAVEIYYVYAILDDVPTDLADCAPFLEYIVNVDPCSELEVNCLEGRAIETYYTGINRDIPKTLSFSDLPDIDSVLVQIVYENNSPGNSISIQDAMGNTFNINRVIKNDIHLFERVIPATASITYSNPAIQEEAQSITAYVYKSNQPGKSYARYSQQVSGHANTKQISFPLPDRTTARDITIKLPVSELTYDNRELTFTVRAGAYTNTFTKKWGPSGNSFPKGCCIDLLNITVPNVATHVDNITIDIFSPNNARGQSYIIAGTVFLEFNCFDNEDCTDNVDNDFDGDIDAQDFDCSGYCEDNGTFLPYGMLELANNTQDFGLHSAEYDLTFKMTRSAFLYWSSGNNFALKGTLAAYDSAGAYVGKYRLSYAAENVNYNTFEGDDILGSISGIGKLTQLSTNTSIPQEISMSAQPNSGGWGILIRAYGINDIRVEGDWSLAGWTTTNTFNAIVNFAECQAPREICGNGEDDDMDGLTDCQDPDCTNPNNGGTITGNETNCGLYLPTIITEQNAPSGMGTGVPDYQWEYQIGNGDWIEIPEAIEINYMPNLINQTTKFRRKIRMGVCNPWLTSNPINKIVTPPPFDAMITNTSALVDGVICADQRYTFQAEAVTDAIYSWEFGDYATPSSAIGIGPHEVTFTTPTNNTPINSNVLLNVIGTTNLCVASDTAFFDIHPVSELIAVNSGNPSLCGASDGWITITATGETGRCIEVSLDGGMTYQAPNQFSFTNLSSGSYEIVTRYCDGTCANIGQLVNLSDPVTISLVNDDFLNVCPGFDYAHNVLFNDDIQGETILTLASDANYGTVTLEPNGDFVYSSETITCDADQFAYTICDASGTCCATAVVTIDFNDTEAPILENIPVDLTVNCDEEIPLPPLVSASDNCPAISIDKKETNNQGEDGCSLYDYTITYSWIARDFCGNEAIDSQLIQVKDRTAPDIYRIYTLPNGSQLVAGVMENVTHRWKVIQLPITFKSTPLIFTQLVTTNEATPAIARLRNTSANQFEIKLQEEMANDGERTGESVAWFAIEAGTQLTDYQLEAATEEVGDAAVMLDFQQAFTETPAFFTTMQTIKDNDPAYPRNNGLSKNNVVVNIQEEASIEGDNSHTKEKLAYLAIDTTVLKNQTGDVFGETGKVVINNNWTTINLKNTYVNPVVIANSLSQNEVDPAIVQINNITTESFDIRVKKWDYLVGTHTGEQASFIVIEGSVPLNSDRFCEYGTDSLVLGVDIVAVDNCDQNVTINYEELVSYNGPEKIFTRIWSAIDECENETIYAKNVLCSGVLLQIKAFLQGAVIANRDGMMRDDLRRKGYLPLTEPYSKHPNFTHIGGGGETMEGTMLNETGKDACVDWVFIELCDGNDINTVVATSAGIIQRDGDVMTATGDTLIRFENVPPGNYYVALNHRNHLRTVSLYPYTFTPSAVPFVDFTNEFTPVIGVEPNIDLTMGKAMWSGDLNGDDQIIYQGPRNDVFNMFLHVILDSMNQSYLTNFIGRGYTDNDFNMDGTVIFQGPNNDKSTLLFNTVLAHPNNPVNFSNFVISTHAEAQILNGNNPDGTLPGFDYDNDGILDGLDPDDDNDGVADGNDSDRMNPNSDSDGDGISDNTETGGDGQYDPLTDSDPLNPCSPNISNQCMGIDLDQDGYFRNYPTNHPLYDAEDQNVCLPNTSNSNCLCGDTDGDGFIEVCHRKGNGQTSTKRIPLSALSGHLNHGDTCGPCN